MFVRYPDALETWRPPCLSRSQWPPQQLGSNSNITSITRSNSRKKHYTAEEIKIARRATFAKYSANKKSQTPTDADLVLIKEIYANCPKGMEVDHIIPISLGGVHHQDNLQYLTPEEN